MEFQAYLPIFQRQDLPQSGLAIGTENLFVTIHFSFLLMRSIAKPGAARDLFQIAGKHGVTHDASWVLWRLRTAWIAKHAGLVLIIREPKTKRIRLRAKTFCVAHDPPRS